MFLSAVYPQERLISYFFFSKKQQIHIFRKKNSVSLLIQYVITIMLHFR